VQLIFLSNLFGRMSLRTYGSMSGESTLYVTFLNFLFFFTYFLLGSFFDPVLEINHICTCACFNLCRMLFIQINRSLQNTTSAQSNLKIATEDNFARNQSTDSASVASSQKNYECSEKLSKAQVSSTYKHIT